MTAPVSSLAMLRISVLGPLRILAEDGAEVSGLSRRGQGLLAFLALQTGHRAERALIADLLWSDRSDAQARASLRQELSVLRKLLPTGILESDRQRVWLVAERIVVDEASDGLLLDGFDLRSEAFEEWLREARLKRDTPGLPPSRSERPLLAVLPFEELGLGERDFFADGVVEEITGALSQVREFDVIARQSAYALGPGPMDPREAAAALGADYVVEGSIRRAGNRVRIAVQLVDGAEGRTLWSERFDDRLDDLFDLQDRIASSVAGQMSPQLRAIEIARAGRCNHETTSAYELTLTALPHFWVHSRKENTLAIALLGEAIRRDPTFGPARAYRAWALAQQPSYMWSDDPLRDHAQALAEADEAIGLTTDHAPSLVAISATYALSHTDPNASIQYAKRALEIDPNNAWGWLRMGYATIYGDEPEQAISMFERAERLSPLDPFRYNMTFGKSVACRELGDYDSAVAYLREGMLQNPNATWALRPLVGTLSLSGRMDEAVATARDLVARHPDLTLAKMRSCWPRTINSTRKVYSAAFEEPFIKAGIPLE